MTDGIPIYRHTYDEITCAVQGKWRIRLPFGNKDLAMVMQLEKQA